MLAAPPGYPAAARGSHRVAFTCDVVAWDRSATIATGLPIDGGTLRVVDAAVRRTGSVRIPDAGGAYAPRAVTDLLHPYAHNLIRVTATVTADAVYSIVLATCRIRAAAVDTDRGGSKVTLTLADDADEALAGRSWPGQPLTQARDAETLEQRVLATLLLTHPPAAVGFVSPATGVSVPAGQVVVGPKAKTWADLVTLCRGYGWSLGVEPAGHYALRPITTGGVVTVGGPSGLPASVAQQSWDMRDFANTASYLVNNPDIGTAYGTAPDNRYPVTSPNADGRWGIVWTYEESSDAHPVNAAALAAALRDREAGAARQVSFQASPDYRLEGGDRAAVNLPGAGVVGSYGVAEVAYTLTPGAKMQVKCQEARNG